MVFTVLWHACRFLSVPLYQSEGVADTAVFSYIRSLPENNRLQVVVVSSDKGFLLSSVAVAPVDEVLELEENENHVLRFYPWKFVFDRFLGISPPVDPFPSLRTAWFAAEAYVTLRPGRPEAVRNYLRHLWSDIALLPLSLEDLSLDHPTNDLSHRLSIDDSRKRLHLRRKLREYLETVDFLQLDPQRVLSSGPPFPYLRHGTTHVVARGIHAFFAYDSDLPWQRYHNVRCRLYSILQLSDLHAGHERSYGTILREPRLFADRIVPEMLEMSQREVGDFREPATRGIYDRMLYAAIYGLPLERKRDMLLRCILPSVPEAVGVTLFEGTDDVVLGNLISRIAFSDNRHATNHALAEFRSDFLDSLVQSEQQIAVLGLLQSQDGVDRMMRAVNDSADLLYCGLLLRSTNEVCGMPLGFAPDDVYCRLNCDRSVELRLRRPAV